MGTFRPQSIIDEIQDEAGGCALADHLRISLFTICTCRVESEACQELKKPSRAD